MNRPCGDHRAPRLQLVRPEGGRWLKSLIIRQGDKYFEEIPAGVKAAAKADGGVITSNSNNDSSPESDPAPGQRRFCWISGFLLGRYRSIGLLPSSAAAGGRQSDDHPRAAQARQGDHVARRADIGPTGASV
ncbi:hypothetical protein ABT294_03520 [Nonomuraea sp. NPDC000554]|uniref:hypothetical protein n=1 Tax=Nonomuraea sp. NPDC000554 TaxID=3154259 RepID=UPI00331A9CC3